MGWSSHLGEIGKGLVNSNEITKPGDYGVLGSKTIEDCPIYFSSRLKLRSGLRIFFVP